MASRLPSLSTREVVAALRKAGFEVLPGRGKGPHVFLHRSDPPPRIGITVPNTSSVKRGTLRSIIREARLSVDEFLDLH